MSDERLPAGVLAAPLECDRPHAVGAFIGGCMLLSLGMAIATVGIVNFQPNASSFPNESLVAGLICPFVLVALSLIWVIPGATGIVRRKQTLHPKTQVPPEMQPLRDIRWPIGRAAMFPDWDTAVTALARSGYRVVLPPELAGWAAATSIPAGLLEPTSLLSARPETGCRTATSLALLVLLLFLLGPCILMPVWRGANSTSIVAVLILLIAGVLVAGIRIILKLPSMQRHLIGVPILGRWARGGLRQLGAVAGPGWVRLGDRVWQAERDLLLIRLRGRHSPETSLEVMVAGKPGRLRFVVAGVGDPMLRALWSAWMCPDVRPDLAMTDLAAAAR